jgi:Flp pilus assembly protein TadG
MRTDGGQNNMGCIRMWTRRKRTEQNCKLNRTGPYVAEWDCKVKDTRLAPVASQGRKLRSSQGQTLLEFALVFPMFLVLLCGVVDFCHLFYVEMTLQNAVRQAGRFATTGNHLADPKNPGQNLSRVNSIIQTVQQAATGLNVPSNSINISSTNGGKGSAGGPGDVVTISINTGVQMMTPLTAPFFKPNGTYNFTASVTFKNEPFPPGQT